jgi:hypothetical protein
VQWPETGRTPRASRMRPASRPAGCGPTCLRSRRSSRRLTQGLPRWVRRLRPNRPPLPPKALQRPAPAAGRAGLPSGTGAPGGASRVPAGPSSDLPLSHGLHPPCPIMRIIRLRPGRPFPWPTALHNRGLCKLGAGPLVSRIVVPTSTRSRPRRQRLSPRKPRREIGPPAGCARFRPC